MLSFTKQERIVIFVLMTIIATGATLQILFKEYPQLRNSVNLIEGDKLYFKVDINNASYDELVAIPFIGDYTAKKILFYRRNNGRFQSLLDLKKVKGIRDQNYERFKHYLTVKKD